MVTEDQSVFLDVHPLVKPPEWPYLLSNPQGIVQLQGKVSQHLPTQATVECYWVESWMLSHPSHEYPICSIQPPHPYVNYPIKHLTYA